MLSNSSDVVSSVIVLSHVARISEDLSIKEYLCITYKLFRKILTFAKSAHFAKMGIGINSCKKEKKKFFFLFKKYCNYFHVLSYNKLTNNINVFQK